ncbi:MAG: HEPN domain-containing protein [Blastocatellia bacterium]
MKPSTAEWVGKAEDDWEMALKAFRARKYPVYDAAGYHSQQCAEKYLKASLVEAGLAVAKTHDLLKLLNRILPIRPNWLTLQPPLNSLNKYSVLYRYPGHNAIKADARQAIQDCREVRRTIRVAFGLPV